MTRRKDGESVATSNAYLTHLKSFCTWLVKSGKAPSNPFDHLEGGNEATDKRHHRRELTACELQKLLTVTRASKRSSAG